jgi:hypothetical protein
MQHTMILDTPEKVIEKAITLQDDNGVLLIDGLYRQLQANGDVYNVAFVSDWLSDLPDKQQEVFGKIFDDILQGGILRLHEIATGNVQARREVNRDEHGHFTGKETA